ncbi:excisionase family DNA-binding protein [Kribbella sp. NPDC051936]|uniref:excisionase family DNA-binding protein n=1 Tax=Kribbella sp. NPDC051936 TaxID=3154946 RepID=UPI0034483971
MPELQILMTVEQAAKALSVGRTQMFKLIADGSVQSVLIGRSRRVSVDAIREYARKLETSAA